MLRFVLYVIGLIMHTTLTKLIFRERFVLSRYRIRTQYAVHSG